MKSGDKAILLTLPASMAAGVDQASAELRQTRLEFIRETIRRGLLYYHANERPYVLHLREKADETMTGASH